MKIRIDIDTANAAFDGNVGPETARILRDLADTLDHYPETCPRLGLVDANGNLVGLCRPTGRS